MKRLLASILCLALLASAAGCATSPEEVGDSAPEAPVSEVVEQPREEAPEPSAGYDPGTYTASATGMNGAVAVEVTFSGDAITGIVVTDHSETPGIGDTAIQRLPDAIVSSQSLAVDVVTGATLTSEAIFAAVADCVIQAGGAVDALQNTPVDSAAGDPEEYTSDIVIVGAGGSGLFAAVEATRAGADVIVLEKSATVLASNSNQIGGISGVESSITREAGETYTADQLYNKLLDYAHYTVNPTLLRRATELSGDTIDLFVQLGIEFVLGEDRFESGFHNVHNFVTSDKMGFLEKEASGNGARFLFETAGTQLIMDNGVCVGVKAVKADGTPVTVNAKAVLIATGGFLGDEEMMKSIFGDINVHVMAGTTTCTGDGIRMVVEAGGLMGKSFALSLNDLGGTNAKSSSMNNFGEYMMDRNQALTFGLGCGLFVNAQGKRFFNEYKLANEPLAAGGEALLHSGPGGYYYTVINQELVDAAVEQGYYKAIGSPEIWSDARLNEDNPVIMHNIPLPRLQEDLDLGVSEGWIWKGDSIEDLAAQAGMAHLADTVAAYDEMCKNGQDTLFSKDPSMLNAIGEGPYYLIEYQPGSWCTMGGVVTDENLNAVTPSYEPIPGLYVAGGDNSSLYAAPYYDVGGSSSGLAFNSGRLAGMEMARYVKEG